jgi:nitric oxide reductase large subunit
MIHSPVMQALVWARVPGDMVFTVGAVAFALFVFQALRASGQVPRQRKLTPIGEDIAPVAAE